LVRIAHIICNHPLFSFPTISSTNMADT